MRSRSSRSTGRSRRPTPAPRGVDVYLFPAVIGGGLGDIEEVLAGARELARAGFPIRLYRRAGRPLPRWVDGPWDWPPIERCRSIRPRAAAAMTLSPDWGVSAAPGRAARFCRAGPWAEESADVERAYGTASTIHVSLGEFARTLTASGETRERLREGGVPSRELKIRLARARAVGEVDAFRDAFVRFRAFARPNVLHVFASFRPQPAFVREFPNAVETGPLWPSRHVPARKRRDSRSREWVWYASPASAETIAPAVVEGLAQSEPPVHLFVRTARPWPSVRSDERVSVATDPMGAAAWRRRFSRAELRIVTGSRTLLEALELGGPFLYFNGVLGIGPARRRHRPEKVDALLDLARSRGVSSDLLRDLRDFAQGRRVSEVVARAAARRDGWARFPRRLGFRGFAPPYDDAGRFLVSIARALSDRPTGAAQIVADARAGRPL